MNHDQRIMLRNVTLLHVQPGRADAPKTGQPIGIVTLASPEGIESLLLNLRDTKALAIGLLEVLWHHGDERALKVREDYMNDKGFS